MEREDLAQHDCVPVGRRCVPFDDIHENTEIYVGRRADGTLTGFVAFDAFAAWTQSEYGVRVWLANGRVRFDLTPDPPERGPHASALWATFYDRGDFTGTAFVLNPPNAINDLRDVRRPNGGTWNNRISSVAPVQGTPGLPGAALCARVGCQTPGWVLLVDNQTRVQLLGGFNNTASYVAVFQT